MGEKNSSSMACKTCSFSGLAGPFAHPLWKMDVAAAELLQWSEVTTSVLNNLFSFWKLTIKLLIIDSVSLNVICWKQNAMKLVRCVYYCV